MTPVPIWLYASAWAAFAFVWWEGRRAFGNLTDPGYRWVWERE